MIVTANESIKCRKKKHACVQLPISIIIPVYMHWCLQGFLLTLVRKGGGGGLGRVIRLQDYRYQESVIRMKGSLVP